MDALLTCYYVLVAFVASVLYGFRGFLISRMGKNVTTEEICHQVWFNAACSGMGWLAGYWVLGRFSHPPIGVPDLIVMIFAALGIVGYLPQTLNAIPGLLKYLGQLLEEKMSPTRGS